jgi:hypothetical protein
LRMVSIARRAICLSGGNTMTRIIACANLKAAKANHARAAHRLSLPWKG